MSETKSKPASKGPNKTTLAIIKDLQASDDAIVKAALLKAAEKGNVMLISPLIDLLCNRETSPVVFDMIQGILFQLKISSAVPPIIDALEDEKTEGFRHILVASLWESGLKVDEYLMLFTELAIHEDFQTCLECLTVIENMEGPFEDDEIIEASNLVQEALLHKSPNEELLNSIREILTSKLIGE